MQYNSKVFNALKSVNESLDSNYTTSQLLTTLDNLLHRAVDLLIDHTNWLDLFAGQIITWYGDDSKRRISTKDKDRVLELLYLFITSENPEDKKRLVRALELERNIWFGACKLFLERSAPAYQHVRSKDFFAYEVQVNKLRVALMAKAGGDLYVAHRDVKFWYEEAIRFKTMIMEKYMRHVTSMANSYYRSRNNYIDLDDLLQNYMVAVSKAVDKCSSSKGTLTTVVNFQLRSAQNSSHHGHEYGIAYTVPPNMKERLAKGAAVTNFGVSLDSEEALSIPVDGPNESVERYDNILYLRRLAKYADPKGVARMELGIQEILDDDELEIVKRLT